MPTMFLLHALPCAVLPLLPVPQYPTTWMHELGHNLYLNHAGSFQQVAGGGTQFVAYKDDSGAMGHCCSTRCFNAPHSHQLGWSKAVDTLNKDNFGAGAAMVCRTCCLLASLRVQLCSRVKRGFTGVNVTRICAVLQQPVPPLRSILYAIVCLKCMLP